MTREEAIAMRLSCQQLVNPRFDSPEEVVDWMGMVQAQDYVNLVSLCRESNLRATRSWAKQIGEEYSEQYYSEGLDTAAGQY